MNAIKNDNPIITHIAPVMLATLIHPRTNDAEDHKTWKGKNKIGIGTETFWDFQTDSFQLRKNGTNAISRIRPEHQRPG